jgi:hypothetical protein
MNANPALRLEGHAWIANVSQVHDYATRLNQLTEFPAGPVSYPEDDDSALWATFTKGSERIDVRAALSGGRQVTNGDTTRRTGQVISDMAAQTAHH